MAVDIKELTELKARLIELEEENQSLANEVEQASHNRIISEKISLSTDKQEMYEILTESVVAYNGLFYSVYYQLRKKENRLVYRVSYCLDNQITPINKEIELSDKLLDRLQIRGAYIDLRSELEVCKEMLPEGMVLFDAYLVPTYLSGKLQGIFFVANNDQEANEYKNHLNKILVPLMSVEQQLDRFVQIKKLEELIKYSSDLIWEIDADGCFISIDAKEDNPLGFTVEELLGQHFSIIIRKDSLSMANDAFTKIKDAHESVKDLGLWHTTKRGRSVFMRVNAFPEFDEQGRLIKVSGLGRDETNKKRAEDDLRQSQQKLALHVEQTPLAVIEWDIDFHVISWNKAAERIFGYSSREAIGQHATDIIIPSEYHEHVDAIWKDLITNNRGNQSTNENVTKYGRVITCDWYNTPLLDEWGRVIGVSSLVEDISEKYKAEIDLKHERDLAQRYLDTAGVLMGAMDNQSRITMINKTGLSLLGYESADELIGKNWFDLCIPDAKREELKVHYEDLMSGKYKGIDQYENSLLMKDGQQRVFIFYNSAVENDSGEINGVVFSAHDVTENKRQEYELLRATENAVLASKAKSDFLANMSHELRTPMHGVLSYADFGLSRTGKVNNEKILQYFSQIKNSGERLLSLLNDLLDISKLESGMMEIEYTRNNLIDIVRSCVLEQKTRLQSLEIEVEELITGDLPEVYCDKKRIGQVVTNLLSNAIKFSPEKGKITFSCFLDQLYNDEGSYSALRLGISDEGEGIPDSDMVTVFDKFIQSAKNKDKGGTGLGLAISKEIIEQHYGVIWAQNTDKGGALFQLIIPVDKLSKPAWR